MISMKHYKSEWNPEELRILKTLDSPNKIQGFLDKVDYNAIIETRSPRFVIQNRRAHCMEGALFGAACLQFIGYPPLVLDLKAENDDDHVIAIFKWKGCWGAIAKSNFTTLRYREPVYRTLRELSMSYFDLYFNSLGEKTLRSYSLPQNLNRFNHIKWTTTEEDLDVIGDWLTAVKHIPLVTPEQVRNLDLTGDYLVKSSLIGSNPAGLYVPKKK